MSDLPLYGGAIIAHRVSGFVRAGYSFDVVRPGFDAQGRKRETWTQIVHEGVPVYEVKLKTPLKNVLDRFEQAWDKTIGDDEDLLARALASVKRERNAKFMDGESGEAPAPALSRDGRPSPPQAPT